MLEKIVINIGIGKFDSKALPNLMSEVALITGQKPSPRPAKKSIAGFKLREGDVVGLKVTLRGKRMKQFLERLNKVVLPRLRDFTGISLENIDQQGNLSIGLREHVVFPEINEENLKVNFGMQITIVPKVTNRTEAIDLYRNIGVPLMK